MNKKDKLNNVSDQQVTGSYKIIYRVCVLIATACAMPAYAQLELPDSARPGAIRPEQMKESTLPKAETVPGLEVPPVIDRPFDVNEGARVTVSQFRVLNAKDLPEFGIELAAVQRILQERIDSKPEGFTIGQLSEAANLVTTYYREKGLILAKAVVPVQTVKEGVVELEVYEGKLGRVLVEGNKLYSQKILSRPFKKLIGEPITQAHIESALLTLTDYPGLSIFGIFQPGQMVGTADILLRVQEEQRFGVALRADNHGTRETGRARGRVTLDWNNPTGAADKLSVTVQQAWRPRNSFFQAYDYERPLGFWGLKGGLTASRNEFDVGGEFEQQGISAKTDNLGGFVEKTFLRSRQRNLSAKVDLFRKDSITYRQGVELNEDRLAVLSLEGNYDSVDTRFQGLNFATLTYSHGFNDLLGAMGSHLDATMKIGGKFPSRRGGSGDFAAGQFNKLSGNFIRLQSLTPLNDVFNLEDRWFDGQSILFSSEIQWSSDILTPLEQYSVGGPDNVRAYGVAEKLYDKALFYSVEYIANAPFISQKEAFGGRTWGELVQLSVFYDFAVGRNNDPLPSEKSAYENFYGAGVGIRFNIPGLVSARVTSAWAINERASTPQDPVNVRHPQIWGDITFTY